MLNFFTSEVSDRTRTAHNMYPNIFHACTCIHSRCFYLDLKSQENSEKKFTKIDIFRGKSNFHWSIIDIISSENRCAVVHSQNWFMLIAEWAHPSRPERFRMPILWQEIWKETKYGVPHSDSHKRGSVHLSILFQKIRTKRQWCLTYSKVSSKRNSIQLWISCDILIYFFHKNHPE